MTAKGKEQMKLALQAAGLFITILIIVVSVTTWLPTMAQEKVDAHVTTQEKIDKTQSEDIEKLDDKVDKLITAQAVTNTRLETATEAMRALAEEIRKGRIR